ncbi:MAG: catechol 2,3-dioxygenase-like lactoylglutathione lyase family enzyme [Marinomonas primoryensis]|jgi:catechol 2,3-dioxygenase-like lactoylglutathione lyase family enzyme
MDKLSNKKNPYFDIQGLNHIALVCKDMKKTVDFYEGVLGMPLVKTTDLPNGLGQHFFFDIGKGASLAFFWFPDAPPAEQGVTITKTLMGEMGDVTTAIGSMNHIAFDVDADKVPEYKQRLEAAGIMTSPVIHHNDTEEGVSFDEVHSSNWVSSVYFQDPDGIQLEFAGWTRMMTQDDVIHEAATESDKEAYLKRKNEALAAS